VVYALWREDKAKFPTLRWDVVALPLVRVEFANILLQAWKNGVFSLAEGDRAELKLQQNIDPACFSGRPHWLC